MTATFSADEILEIAGARLADGMMPDERASICADTRELKEGQWFLALPGRTFDGHDFIGDAFSRGALGCIVEERSSYPIASTSFPLLAVDDTEDALCALARSWRKRNQARLCLIAAAGDQSSDLLDKLEKAEGAFDASFLLHSNLDWKKIAFTLLELTPATRALAIEYQPIELAKIEEVARMVAPDAVLILPQAFSHLRLQSSPDKILHAESALVESLNERVGVLLVAEDAALRNKLETKQKTHSVLSQESSEISFEPLVDFEPEDFAPPVDLIGHESVIVVDKDTDLGQLLMEILHVRQS